MESYRVKGIRGRVGAGRALKSFYTGLIRAVLGYGAMYMLQQQTLKETDKVQYQCQLHISPIGPSHPTLVMLQ